MNYSSSWMVYPLFDMITFYLSQQRERVASAVHRQETVDCLKKFNARRKLKVNISLNYCDT